MNQQLRYQAAGSLSFLPTQTARVTGSPTVLIRTPGGSTHVASQSASKSLADTTITAAAAEGATSLAADDKTAFTVGKNYILLSEDGYHEWVRLKAVDATGLTLTLAEPLLRAFESGAELYSNELTVSLSLSETDPLGEGYEAQWTYDVGADTFVVQSLFDIVRSPWPAIILQPWEFAMHVPGSSTSELEHLGRTGLQFADEIAQATERVREDLLDRGMRPDLFRSFDAFKRPVALRVVLDWAMDGFNIPSVYEDIPSEYLAEKRDEYGRALTRAQNITRSYDEDEDGAVSETERTTRWGSPRLRM